MGEARVKHSSSAGGENHAGPVRSRGDAALRAAAGGIFHPRSLRRQGPLRQMPREGERRAAPCLQDESAGRRLDRPARDDARRHPDGARSRCRRCRRAARALARQSTSVRRRWRCGSSTAQTESCSRRLRTGTRRRPTARTLSAASSTRWKRPDGLRRAVALYPRADRDAFSDRHFPPPDGRRMKSRSSSLRAIP